MDDTADGRTNEAERRDGKAEALAAEKAVLRFVDVAPVHRLTRALTITKGEEQTRRGEDARDE